MYTQDVIDFIEQLWFCVDDEEISLEKYKELGEKRIEVKEYLKKLSGVH